MLGGNESGHMLNGWIKLGLSELRLTCYNWFNINNRHALNNKLKIKRIIL
jgi:hypothetical protein